MRELLGLLAVFQGMTLILLFVLIRRMADLPVRQNVTTAPLTIPTVQAIDLNIPPNGPRRTPEAMPPLQAIINQLQEVQRQLSDQTPERNDLKPPEQ